MPALDSHFDQVQQREVSVESDTVSYVPGKTFHNSSSLSTDDNILTAPSVNPGGFTETEIDGFHNDDAMAGGMIGAILSMAFLVLLGLVTAVNIWMSRVVGS